MPVFVRLPSGLTVNLMLIGRVVPAEAQDGFEVTVYFGHDDSMRLDAADGKALMRRLGSSSVMTTNVKVIVFWLVIFVAVILVWLTVRTSHG